MFFKKKEEIEFPKTVEINSTSYTVVVSFYKKKSSSVSFKENTLHFRLSSYLSYNETRSHFKSLLDSISKKLSTLNISSTSFKDIIEKKMFYFAGKQFTIILHNKRITKISDSVVYVDENLSLEIMEKKIKKLLLKHFSQNLVDYVHYINSISYRAPITGVVVKDVSSKWGHCTHTNEILMNIKLLNAPKEVLDYVIYHELSHVKHKNHSSAFWNEVARFCPNYKYLRSELKKNPPSFLCLDNNY